MVSVILVGSVRSRSGNCGSDHFDDWGLSLEMPDHSGGVLDMLPYTAALCWLVLWLHYCRFFFNSLILSLFTRG